MANELTITTETLIEPQVSSRQWLTVFLAGFVLGAIGELFSLWLFAYWLHIH